MSTPTGHHDDEPIDEPVRQLFWRLRARLVTPPDEQRTEADLDRLVRLARERAHAAPSVRAGAQPGAVSIDSARPDHPVTVHAAEPVALQTTEHGSDDTVVPLRRGLAFANTLGRVAAVAVMAVAVSVGVAGARDGSVSLDALLGRDTGDDLAIESTPDVPPVVPATPEDSSDGSSGDGSEGDGSDDEPGTSDDGPDLDVVPDLPDDEATAGVPSDDAQDEPRDTDQDAEPATQVPSDRSTPDPAPAPAPEPTETGAVVAAPPVEPDLEQRRPTPDDLQGAGGPVPCEADDLADCVADDGASDDGAPGHGAGEDDVASDGGAVAEDDGPVADVPADDEVIEVEPVDESATDTDTAEEQDDLAARRFGGDS